MAWLAVLEMEEVMSTMIFANSAVLDEHAREDGLSTKDGANARTN